MKEINKENLKYFDLTVLFHMATAKIKNFSRSSISSSLEEEEEKRRCWKNNKILHDYFSIQVSNYLTRNKLL